MIGQACSLREPERINLHDIDIPVCFCVRLHCQYFQIRKYTFQRPVFSLYRLYDTERQRRSPDKVKHGICFPPACHSADKSMPAQRVRAEVKRRDLKRVMKQIPDLKPFSPDIFRNKGKLFILLKGKTAELFSREK